MRKAIIVVLFFVSLPLFGLYAEPVRIQNKQALERRKAVERIREQKGLDERFVIGTVCANTKRKRLDRIIESYALFSEKVKDSLLLIKTDRAKGTDGTDLRVLAGRHKVENRVMILESSFGEKQMAETYNLMDLYITLSEWEGFCIPVIEAMACGVPVVTHPVQGPGEIVPYGDLTVSGSEEVFDGDTRILLADPDNASRALLLAYNMRGGLNAIRVHGRKEAEKRYDMRVVARMWGRLMGSV